MSNSKLKPHQLPVKLEPYSPSWLEHFHTEETALQNAVGKHIKAIEHFGSTSIPNMSAKPTVDILVGITSFPWQHDEALANIEYQFYKSPRPDWRVYLKPFGEDVRGYHLHIVLYNSEHWRSHILFRDYLREHPREAAKYAAEKLRLANLYGGRRGRYQAGKQAIIDEIMTKAERWSA